MPRLGGTGRFSHQGHAASSAHGKDDRVGILNNLLEQANSKISQLTADNGALKADLEDADGYRQFCRENFKDTDDLKRAAIDWKLRCNNPDAADVAALLGVTQLAPANLRCICGTPRARTHLCGQHGPATFDDLDNDD